MSHVWDINSSSCASENQLVNGIVNGGSPASRDVL